jgi:quinol monooxygenase YgiN
MESFIFARFHVRDGNEGEASAVLRDQARHVRDEAGCLMMAWRRRSSTSWPRFRASP